VEEAKEAGDEVKPLHIEVVPPLLRGVQSPQSLRLAHQGQVETHMLNSDNLGPENGITVTMAGEEEEEGNRQNHLNKLKASHVRNHAKSNMVMMRKTMNLARHA
jgi:riboflavin synthase